MLLGLALHICTVGSYGGACLDFVYHSRSLWGESAEGVSGFDAGVPYACISCTGVLRSPLPSEEYIFPGFKDFHLKAKTRIGH